MVSSMKSKKTHPYLVSNPNFTKTITRFQISILLLDRKPKKEKEKKKRSKLKFELKKKEKKKNNDRSGAFSAV